MRQRRPDAYSREQFATLPFSFADNIYIHIPPQGAPKPPPYRKGIRNIQILSLQTVSEFAINTFTKCLGP